MAYANTADITTRYGDDFLSVIADRDDDGVLDTVSIEDTLADASDFIDSYLASKHTLPLSSFPKQLTRYCVDIAVYWLAENAGGLTEEKRLRYEDARRWLEQVSKGGVELLLAAVDAEPGEDTTSGDVEISSSVRLFSRDTLQGF